MNELPGGIEKIVLIPGMGIAEKMKAVREQELLIAESKRRIHSVLNSQLTASKASVPVPVVPKGKVTALSGYIDPTERGHYVTHRPTNGSNKKSEKKIVYGTNP